MKHFYDRPPLKIRYWLVTKADLKKIYDFLLRRYNISHLEVRLETASGNNKIYDSFEQFVDDVNHIIESKEIIKRILIDHREDMGSGTTAIWIGIDFISPFASFFIEGKGDKVKDWIDGAYEEMQRIVKAVELTDETLIKALKKKFGKNYPNSVIVFDPNDEIRESLKDVPTILTKVRTSWHNTWWGMLIILVASLVLGTIILRLIGII
ncbi:MAG TPA: hypothetical protein ACFYD6_12410 [Candidatus Brocadiia bacterium]|nr:hypothetical protein [Planctomycetota bacterium]MDO8092207.1 hypothetical protein [Candidatus Brocadiales bacterium]